MGGCSSLAHGPTFRSVVEIVEAFASKPPALPGSTCETVVGPCLQAGCLEELADTMEGLEDEWAAWPALEVGLE